MGVKIVTDSTSDIPSHLIKKYEIIELPLTVHFEDGEYRDRIDLTPEEFYSKLAAEKSLPSTSQVNPSVFFDKYKEIIDGGDSVISIHISSDLSGTYQSALIAKNMLDTDKISVIDSKTATAALGMIVLKAAEHCKNGCEHNIIVQNIEEYKNNINLLIAVDTLEYLKKGGRLSGVKAAIGEMFNIKPLLTIKDGKVIMIDKVRGSKKVLGRMLDLMKENCKSIDNMSVGIASANNPDAIAELKNMISQEFKTTQFVETEVGSVIATHVGPGAFGLVYESRS